MQATIRLTIALAVVAISAAVAVAQVSAAGGSSVAAAPLVAVGAHLYGNTASYNGDSSGCFCTLYYEYWRLHLIAGDSVLVKFENASGAMNPGVTGVDLFPAGTDDFNISQTSSLAETVMNSNGHAELSDSAVPSTGDYPLRYYSKDSFSSPGAYDFWVYVKHRVRLDVDAAHLSRSGQITAAAHFPDGTAVPSGLGVTLSGSWTKGAWHKLGSGVVRNGTIVIRYRFPKGVSGRVKLSFNAGGPTFLGARVVKTARVR